MFYEPFRGRVTMFYEVLGEREREWEKMANCSSRPGPARGWTVRMLWFSYAKLDLGCFLGQMSFFYCTLFKASRQATFYDLVCSFAGENFTFCRFFRCPVENSLLNFWRLRIWLFDFYGPRCRSSWSWGRCLLLWALLFFYWTTPEIWERLLSGNLQASGLLG